MQHDHTKQHIKEVQGEWEPCFGNARFPWIMLSKTEKSMSLYIWSKLDTGKLISYVLDISHHETVMAYVWYSTYNNIFHNAFCK